VRALLVLLLCPGCFWFTTKVEGDQLRADVKDLKSRVGKQEESVDTKVKELDDSIAKATKVLSSNSADLGSQVQSVSDDLAKLNGAVSDLKIQLTALQADYAAAKKQDEDTIAKLIARVDTLERAAGVVSVGPSSQPVTMTRDQLFADAQRKLDAGQYADARREFSLFISANPNDANAEKAQFGLAESYYRDHQNDKAIGEYARQISTYPKGQLIDSAYFEAGQAALEIKRCPDARAFYSELVRLFPKSSFADKAKSKLDLITKSIKDKNVCAS
jgi:TolA-binding protein